MAAAASTPVTAAPPALRSVRSGGRTSQTTPSIKSGTQIQPQPVGRPTQPISLSRRLLFPHLPPGADLPPLLAAPGAPRELDAELYDFIALALRAFVNPWWTKITRYDKDFLPQITRVLGAVVRALEARLLATDLAPFALHDVPVLVGQHFRDYRNAASKVATSYASGGAASVEQLFHQLQPHMAVSVDGTISEEYVRQAVDHVLKACLPPEDFEPEVERFIVREIILMVLLRSVVPKITQPWFIQKSILDILGPSLENEKAAAQTSLLAPRRTISKLVVFFLSAIQSISGFFLAVINTYKQTVHTVKLVNQSSPSPAPAPATPGPVDAAPPSSGASPSSAPPTPVAREPSPPGKASASAAPSPPTGLRQRFSYSSSVPSSTSTSGDVTAQLVPPASHHGRPNYAGPAIELVGEVLTMHDRFASSALLRTLEMLAAAGGSFLDRFLPYMLYTRALSAAQAIYIVRTGKRTLFPDGWPAPPPVDPTAEEQAQIRQCLIARILEVVPGVLAPALGPDNGTRVATVEAALDPLASQACNAHLVVLLLDLVLLTLFPEMGVGGAKLQDHATGRREDVNVA